MRTPRPLVPVLGLLFSSTQYEREETELLVVVTARLVEPLAPTALGRVLMTGPMYDVTAPLFGTWTLDGREDEVVTVADPDIIRAVAWLYRNARIVVEPSGAVTTAAVMLGRGGIDHTRGPVVAIVSGGNVEAEQYARYITGQG